MWCGCGPAQGATTRAGQPFSTGDVGPDAGSQATVEWVKLGAPLTTAQMASAPRGVAMNQRQDQMMRKEPVD